MADVAKDNETLLDSLANSAKLELFKWPKTARKKKLGDIFPPAGTNCIKIGLPGKLILSKRKGHPEIIFSGK